MGWGFIGDIVETAGHGLQALGDGATGLGQVLTGDMDGARESFGNAGGHLSDMGGSALDALGGLASFALAPGLYIAREALSHLDDIWNALDGLKDRVQGWLDGLLSPLGWLFDKVGDLFRGIWDAAKDLVDQARKILRGVNAPETLQKMAQRWRDEPSKALAAMIPEITQRTELTEIGWNDMAGQAYKQGVPHQIKAVAATKGLCDKTAQSLDDTAKALLAYYTDCGGVVGRVYAATHGSPGSLFNLDALTGVFGGGLGSLFTIIKGMSNFAEETARIQKEMGEAVKNSDAFINGEWPMAQTGIATNCP